MSNEITINPIEIFKLEDNSITDAETIRQIALWGITYNDNSLANKIKKEFQFAGLYPHVQNYNPEVSKKISESGKEYIDQMLEKLSEERVEFKNSNRKAMEVNPGISLTPEFKFEGQYPRTAMHYDSNDENYQKELVYDKYEIMLSANSKSVYPVGHLHKFTNEIFNKNTGIAFFQIDKEWDVLWTRKFTGFFDKNKEEIYDGDYLEDDNIIYLVNWNRNQTQWWLSPVNNKSIVNKDELAIYDKIFIYATNTQSLGNGYFKRDDLKKIGNKYENPKLLENE